MHPRLTNSLSRRQLADPQLGPAHASHWASRLSRSREASRGPKKRVDPPRVAFPAGSSIVVASSSSAHSALPSRSPASCSTGAARRRVWPSLWLACRCCCMGTPCVGADPTPSSHRAASSVDAVSVRPTEFRGASLSGTHTPWPYQAPVRLRLLSPAPIARTPGRRAVLYVFCTWPGCC